MGWAAGSRARLEPGPYPLVSRAAGLRRGAFSRASSLAEPDARDVVTVSYLFTPLAHSNLVTLLLIARS